ncbi:MAG: hypothetical protein ACLTXT_05090 [Ruminococcus callidus]
MLVHRTAYAVACSTAETPVSRREKVCRRTITVMTAAVMAVAVLIVMASCPTAVSPTVPSGQRQPDHQEQGR